MRQLEVTEGEEMGVEGADEGGDGLDEEEECGVNGWESESRGLGCRSHGGILVMLHTRSGSCL